MTCIKKLKSSTALFTLGALFLTAPETNAQNAANESNTDVIIVTGSNIGGRTQANSPSPIDVISASDISAQGINVIGDLARNMTFNTGSELMSNSDRKPNKRNIGGSQSSEN